MTTRRISLLSLLTPLGLGAQQLDSATVAARADRAFAAVAATASNTTPGCAAAVAQNGRQLWARAIGMADLEFGIPNTPQTIFETGSVAKQFTAASVVLLALDGKLGLDEPVRKYVPELPDYGKPLTIRHLLNHTSGIRDWGSVLGLTGFGRGDRVVSQVLAMDVITHQKGIDFTPGAEYSYSNSGYTLLTTIVERVSKQSLPAFTQERLFKPLGITAQWRDDYQRLVSGRAQAYAPAGGGGAGARGTGGPSGSPVAWRLEMPFMNVYGNGGLLMTVGDMLKWNAMLESRSLGGALVDSLERRGRLNDGREITYALGLTVNTYRGLHQVAHSGSTAGYNAYLTRFPDLKLSVAVMCNAASVSSTGVAMRLVEEIAGPLPNPPAPDTVSLPVSELEKRVGLWREVATHLPVQTTVENGALRVVGGPVLRPLRDGSFLAAQGPVRWSFEPGGGGRPAKATRTAVDGTEHFVAEPPWAPTAAELAAFSGEWFAEEAGATFTFAVEGGQPVLRQRPATRRALRALYRDHFGPQQGGGTVIWFTRDASGRVTTMHYGTSRLRDMPFVRVDR